MIDIAPNGTGRLILDGFNFPKQDSEDGSPGQALITDGTGNLFFDTVLTELIEDPSPTIKPGSTLDIGGNLITDVGIIEGSNNNEVLSLIDTSSAVNYLEIANNVTGSGVSVRPNGADTNVRLSLRGKGTGSLRLQSTLDLRSTSTTYNFTFLDAIGGADGRDVSFLGPDGDGSGAGGEMRIIAGSGGETGDGGDVHIHSGVGGSVNGDGGDLHFHAGSVPSGGEGDGGNVRIFGGDAAGTDRIGGDVRIWAGQSTGSGALGTVQILDTELNIITEFVEVPSAVNNIENENAATGSGPTIRSTGADTNVDLNLESSGTGNVTPNRLVVPSGDTASRPSSPVVGQHYFDTDVNMPIWFNGSVWVDALGVTVT